MMKQHKLLQILFLLCSISLYAQQNEGSDTQPETDELENLDDLFADPEEDIVVEDIEVDNKSQFEVDKKVEFKGTFYAIGLAAIGWSSWDIVESFEEDFEASAGIKSNFTASIDARPTSDFRLFGSISTSFNPYTSVSYMEDDSDDITDPVWTSPEVSSLFVDYIILDTLYSRLGKFGLSWGQGRFYTSGDLMVDSSSSAMNLKLSLPSIFGLSFVLLTNNSISYGDFTYGGKIDFIFGETLISPGVTYNDHDGFKTLLSLKQVLFKTDFLIDFNTTIKSDNDSLYLRNLNLVGGFYHEWTDIKLYGEYQYSRTTDERNRSNITHIHEASIAFKWNKPFGIPFNMGLSVENYFTDWSGIITPVITRKLFSHLTMTIGLPIVYGADDSLAILNNSDPENRRIALGLSLKLSGSFK